VALTRRASPSNASVLAHSPGSVRGPMLLRSPSGTISSDPWRREVNS
jgi:hypothetical protein